MKNKKKKTEGEIDREVEIKNLLLKPKKQYKSLGIGIHNETFYFGTILEKGGMKLNAIITSDKECYVRWIEFGEGNKKIINDEIKKQFGLNYRFDLFDDCIDYLWSNKSINQWLFENPKNMSIKELYEKIIELNKKFIWHPDERTHVYIACDVISNYFYPIFETKGRTYFQAEFKSGKSEQSKIYKQLSFNPLMASNISPASFERVIESTGGTIIIDNFDNMLDDLKKLILQAIECYYKKGGKNIKADGPGKKPIAFNGYGPLVINNIIGLPEVTISRCNRILMLRTDNKKITDAKIKEEDKFWHELRDKLHICALQNWETVKDTYDKLEVDTLSDRYLEKSEAVLTISKCISEDVYEDLLNFITETNQQQDLKDLSDNWEFILFNELNKLVEGAERTILVKNITEAVEDQILLDEKDIKGSKKIKLQFSHYTGKILSSISLFKKKLYHGNVGYSIKREDLDKIIKIKKFDELINFQKNKDEEKAQKKKEEEGKRLDEKEEAVYMETTPPNPTNHTQHNQQHQHNPINDNNKKNKNLIYNKGVVGVVGEVKRVGDRGIDIISLIKKFDKGNGVNEDIILSVSKLDFDNMMKKLEYERKQGNICEIKSRVWKVLE